ncbi:TPA: hypothetical protein ACH3X2_009774 [Trebouxia sp. C0005]
MLLNTVPRLPVVQPLQRIGCVRCVSHAQRSTGSCLLERPVARQRIRSLISSEQTPFYVANRASPPDNNIQTDFELSVLIEVLPARVRTLLQQHPDLSQLVEVVLDLGRPVLARFANTDQLLSAAPLAKQELQEVTSKVSDFGGDNRAGIDRCLHRISCIRNRDGQIVGLTCRVGRAIAGSANMAADVVLSGKSILLLGRPGVGKTTAIRDISSMLAHVAHKRVVIIDTSNEIAGDGDVPHPGIASARRMQVSSAELHSYTCCSTAFLVLPLFKSSSVSMMQAVGFPCLEAELCSPCSGTLNLCSCSTICQLSMLTLSYY